MKKTLLLITVLTTIGTMLCDAQVCGNHIFTAKHGDFPESYFPYTKREVYVNNGVKFIIAHEGDTYEAIGQEVNISENDIRKFNDVTDWQYEPCSGEVVYLMAKKNKCATQFHKIQDGESLRGISQRYAMSLKTLYKKNIKLGVPLHNLHPGERICISCK